MCGLPWPTHECIVFVGLGSVGVAAEVLKITGSMAEETGFRFPLRTLEDPQLQIQWLSI